MTPGLLVRAVGCTPQIAVRYAEHLNEAFERFSINTPARQADFLAQIAHESGGFNTVVESLNYTVSALLSTFGRHRISEADARALGRTATQRANQQAIANAVYGGQWGAKNLGNTQPGDGWLFRGQGLKQITGRFNAADMTRRIRRFAPDCPDFEADPAALQQPRWAALSAGAFWDSKNLNATADSGDFLAQTKAINGGTNGLADRKARRARARAALIPAPAPVARAAHIPQEAAVPIPAIVTALLPTLVQSIPNLAKMFGAGGTEVSDRNIAVVEKVMGVVTEAVGAVNAQEAIESIQADPGVRQIAADAVEAHWFDIQQAHEQSRAAARKFVAIYDQQKDVRTVVGAFTFVELLSLIMVVSSLVGGFAAVMWADLGPEMQGAIVTLILIGGYTGVREFWFGSSHGSKTKDNRPQA